MEVNSRLLHCGSFSSSVMPKQCSNMTLIECQVQVLNGIPFAIGLRQALQRNANWKLWEFLITMRV